MQKSPRAADDMDVLLKRRRGIQERERLVGALISGQAELKPSGPETTHDPNRGHVLERICPVLAEIRSELAACVEVEHELAGTRRGPVRLGAPLAGRLEPINYGLLIALRVENNRRLIHDPGVLLLAPVIEPADDLMEVIDARAGDRDVGYRMIPGSDQDLLRDLERLVEPERWVRIAVPPTADHEHGAGDSVGNISHRAMAPVRSVHCCFSHFRRYGSLRSTCSSQSAAQSPPDHSG